MPDKIDRIRVLSDLHLDYNEEYPFRLEKDEREDFCVLAGDISGDPKITAKWVKKNVKRGVLISGNHLPYNRRGKTVQQLRNELAKAFPASGDVSYLDSETGCVVKEYGGVLFIGSTFYTDYRLPIRWYNPEGRQEWNMAKSGYCMNDFRWGIREIIKVDPAKDASAKIDWMRQNGYIPRVDEPTLPKRVSKKINISPEDYLKWHDNAFKMFEDALNENEKRESPLPVVLVTHHPIMPECLSDRYVDSEVNASYASDCKDFLDKHKSIKAVVSGHVHHQAHFDYNRRDDKSRVLVVMNPRGYVPRCEDGGFRKDCFIDVSDWTCKISEPSDAEKAERDKRFKKFLAVSSCFI